MRAARGDGVEGWIEETGLSLGWREKRESLAPVVSLHPLSRISLLFLEKMVTALLSNRTLQPRSQSLRMPSRLCWKVGMTWHLRAVRLGRLRLAEAEEAWMRPEASPTWYVGASGLMLHTGTEGVTYMSLAPVSVIAVSEMARLGGTGLQLGGEVKVL